MVVKSLHIRNASIAFDQKILFEGVNLDLQVGEWVALIGRSGVGKSSFLRMIAGLLDSENEQFKGQVFMDDGKTAKGQVAYMSQQDLLIPWLSTLENVLLPIKLCRRPYTHEIEQAKFLIAEVGLTDAIHAYPHQLSGGMSKRVALVRTLIQNKPIILMDEAFSALDAITRYQMHQLIIPLLKQKTVIFVTHDPHEALRLADQVYIMKSGEGLEKIASLSSKKPRDTHDPLIAQLQASLFMALAHQRGDQE